MRFTVQLEIRYGQSWREVVRYDCAHGFVHKDIFNLKRVNKKMDIALDYEEALTFADGDIDDNWEVYREKFLGGGFT